MMAERGIVVSHTTIMRWILRYVPEYEQRWNRYARPVNSSWRMDETAVSVRGGLHYLYRAVDKYGKSVASVLRSDRGMAAAQDFFRKAVATNGSWPTTVNLDGNALAPVPRLYGRMHRTVTSRPPTHQNSRAASRKKTGPFHASRRVARERYLMAVACTC
jgi:transposase-like protein